MGLLDGDRVVLSFPARFVGPVEGQEYFATRGELFGWQIDGIDPEAAVEIERIVGCLPTIGAPVHHAGLQQNDAKSLAAGHSPRLVVEAPAKILPRSLFHDITLERLRRLIENFPHPQRASQLDVLGVGPHQGSRRPGGASAKQLSGGDVLLVPYLLGNQSPLLREIFHRLQEGAGNIGTTRSEFVEGALSGQQRPRPSNAGAVKRRSVFVFSIAVAVVAIPARALWQLDAEHSVDNFDRIEYSGIARRTQPKAHQR